VTDGGTTGSQSGLVSKRKRKVHERDRTTQRAKVAQNKRGEIPRPEEDTGGPDIAERNGINRLGDKPHQAALAESKDGARGYLTVEPGGVGTSKTISKEHRTAQVWIEGMGERPEWTDRAARRFNGESGGNATGGRGQKWAEGLAQGEQNLHDQKRTDGREKGLPERAHGRIGTINTTKSRVKERKNLCVLRMQRPRYHKRSHPPA